MRWWNLVCLLGMLSGGLASAHDAIPGAPQTEPIALVGGKVFPISGPPIEHGTVLFDNGRLVAMGEKVKLPPKTRQIDVRGKHVYPGLFDAHTNVGLVEIQAVRATVDERESGEINPNVEALKAVNPDSEMIPVTRSNGVLLALTSPEGSLLAGKSAVVQLDGWTWEEMSLKSTAALHLYWPSMSPQRASADAAKAKKWSEHRDETLGEIKQAFDDAAAYRTAREALGDKQPLDARWEAMLPVLRGELPVMIHANEVQQIQAALSFVAERKLKCILHGGYDAEHCLDLIKAHKVPIIIDGTYRLPMRGDDDYDAAYTLPERLRKAGVPFCIAGGGRHVTANSRNLPYHAANAVAYGLPAEIALRSITLAPAEILGVADRVGSLEAGKDATLFVCSGDILQTETQVEMAWIQGRAVDLTDRQKQLYRKYQEKYRQQAEVGE